MITKDSIIAEILKVMEVAKKKFVEKFPEGKITRSTNFQEFRFSVGEKTMAFILNYNKKTRLIEITQKAGV